MLRAINISSHIVYMNKYDTSYIFVDMGSCVQSPAMMPMTWFHLVQRGPAKIILLKSKVLIYRFVPRWSTKADVLCHIQNLISFQWQE